MMKTSNETKTQTATPRRAKAHMRRLRANAGSLSRKALSIVMSAILVVGLSPLTKVATADESQASAQSGQGQLPSGTYYYNGNVSFTTIDSTNGFTSSAWDAYRDTGKDGSGNALGIAGSFHLVAFDTLSSSSHIYGNILANHVTNIQDYGVKPEFANIYGHGTLSYIQDYQATNPRFGEQSYSNQAIVFGNNTSTFSLYSEYINNNNTIKFKNSRVTGGTEITFPRTIAQDLDTANTPFIDMSAVKAETTTLSSTLSKHEDAGAMYDFSDQNKKTISYTKGSGCAYLTLPLSALTQNGNPLYIKNLPLDGTAALVINVDCGGADAPIPDQVWLDAGNGQNAGLGENDKDTGYVLWNFTNAKSVTAMGMVSSILAPGATINLKGNSCGTFIGENINVSGETHTRPFHGKFTDDQPKPETTSASVNKQWLDSEGNAEAADVVKAHDGVKVQLYRSVGEAAAEAVADSEVTLNADNKWSCTWDNLPVKDGENAITYTVKEVSSPDGYTSSVTNDGNAFTITNKHKPEVSVSVEKKWEDNGNVDQMRPLSLDVDVMRSVEGGTAEKVTTLTLNDANSWKASLTGLPKESADGKEYTYSVQEGAITGYTGKTESSSTTDEHGNVAYSFTLTNTHAPSKVSVSVSKTWVDGNDQDGIRPKSLAVDVLRSEGENGAEAVIKTLTLSADNDWMASVSDLPVWGSNGKYTYSVSEAKVDGYTSSVKANTDSSGNYTFELTNTHAIETTSVGVTKVWDDGNNADGLRPNSVEIELMRSVDGGKTWEATGEKATLSADKWTCTWDGLAKKANGKTIKYTVREAEVSGYSSSAAVSESADGKFAITLTNKHEQAKTSVSVNKVWNDNNDQDGVRPDSVEVQLWKQVGDSAAVAMSGYKVTLNENNKWQASWTNLPANEDGKAITYTVKETNLSADYTCSVSDNIGKNGAFAYTLTNTHEAGKTSVKVTKAWNDNNNQDGKRPDTVQVQLYANGEKSGEPVTLSADKNWTYTWENLAKKANGKDIAYTVEEVTEVAGYTSSAATGSAKDGFVITNTHKPETVSIPVGKVWSDSDNQDGKRPESVTAQLLANDKVVAQVELNSANNWKHTWKNLPVYENGNAIAYKVQEVKTPDGYTSSVTGDVTKGFTITNTHEVEKTSASVTKTWNDSENQDGKRPESVTVQLLANGDKCGDPVTLNAGNGWSPSWTDLPVYKGGEKIAYSLSEAEVDGYNAEVKTTENTDGTWSFALANTHNTEKTSVSVTKKWDDADNADNIRPKSIEVELLADGVATGETLTLSSANDWTDSFAGLDKYKAGKEIAYSVQEKTKVEGYTTEVSDNEVSDGKSFSYTLINKHVQKTSVSVKKAWVDNNDHDGLRPDSVEVELLADGVATGNKLTLNADNKWMGSFDDLAKKADGKDIVYSVRENTKVSGYETKVDGDAASGFTITNTHETAETSVSVTKEWADSNDQDGKRPTSVQVQLYANGEKSGDAVTLNEGNEWKHAWSNLAKLKGGKEIKYTVEEVEAPADYKSVITGDAAKGFTITNTHAPKTTGISVKKVWADSDDQDGIRPTSVTAQLLANGTVVKTAELSEANSWAASWSDLPVYENGNAIVYKVQEAKTPDGYKVEVTGDAATGFTITNTHAAEKTSASVTKAWNDSDDQDGKRPKSVTVQLYANGDKCGDPVTLTAGSKWSHNWTDLPVYKNGEKIAYTLSEDKVDGYTADVKTAHNTDDGTWSFALTNTHNTEKTSVSVSKAWDDADNQDGIRPGSVKVQLLANGKAQGEPVELSTANGWAYTWGNLDAKAAGQDIEYTVQEIDTPTGYTPKVAVDATNGYVITNKHDVDKTDISVSKAWNDADNQDGARPSSAKVQLYANNVAAGEPVELNAENNWAYQWKDLDVKAKGQGIKYTVAEVDVPSGYEAAVTGSASEGFVVTNTHEVAKTAVSVSKAWNDSDNQDGLRPDSVQVQLYANGDPVGSPVTLNADSSWQHTWSDLDKFANGTEIKYTVAELGAPEGYASVVSSTAANVFTITNTHTAKTASIGVKKAWSDSDNQDGIRPASVTAQLLANGAVVETAELNEGNSWAHAWSDLPVYANGKEITYTVQEAETPEGYTASVSGRVANGFTITNTHETAETAVSVHKVWKDAEGNDQSGVHPAVTAQLYRSVAGGEPEAMTGYTVTLDEANGWTASWSKLPVKSNGNDITYSVQEAEVPAGYTSAVTPDGEGSYAFTLTNTAEKRVAVSVTKAWDDGDNADGVRLDSVTAQLCTVDAQNNPVPVMGKTVELSAANNWAYTWDDLAAVDTEGNAITYIVQEANVPAGYESAVSGGQVEGGNFAFTLTNTHELKTVDINVSKVWNDQDDVDGLRPASVTAQLCYVNAAGETVPVEGAEQKVLDADNGWAAAWSGLVANEGGKAIKYTVREAEVPEGYTSGVTGVDNGDGTYSFMMTNTHEVEVAEFALSGYSVRSITAPVPEADKVCYVDPKISKTLVGRALEADEFTFQLYNKETGEVVSTAKNDVLGMVDFDAANNQAAAGMEPCCLKFTNPGTYTYEVREVSETKDPTIDYSNERIEFVAKIEQVGDKLEATDMHYVYYKDAADTVGTVMAADSHPSITNRVKAIELGLTKTDADTGAVLPGATYGLFRADSTSPEGAVQVAKATSDANGHMTFTTTGAAEAITTGVDYWFEELSAPEGYARSLDQTAHFQIERVGTGKDSGYQLVYADGSKSQLYSVGTVIEFGDGKTSVTDKPLTAAITKVNSARSALAGAKLGVRLADGTDPIDEWTSTGAGHVLSGLKADTQYVLYEATAPDGFEKAADVTFTVDEFGTIKLVDGAWGENVLNSYATDGSLSLVDYTHTEIVEKKEQQREETKTTPSSSKKTGLTQTGDKSPVLPLVVGAVVALAVIVVAGVALTKRRKR